MTTETTTEAPGTGPTHVDVPQYGRFQVYNMKELDALDLRVDWIFDNALVADTPGIFGGREKTLKTSIALDCGISMAMCKPWLGYFQPVRAAKSVYFVGEGGKTFVRDSARRIAAAKGLDLGDVRGFTVTDAVPNVSNAGEMKLVTKIIEDNEAEFAFFDPLYLMMGDLANQGSSVYSMGNVFQRILAACNEAGASPIVLHHFRKSQMVGEVPTLADLSQAGCAEFAGQWLLIGRHKAYDEERPGEHDLTISLGSRMFDSSRRALHVSEGTTATQGGRYWGPLISLLADVRQQERDAKELARQMKEAERLERNREKIMGKLRPGVPQTLTRIREQSGVSPRDFPAAIASLLETGDLIPGDVFTPPRKTPYAGYQMAT